VLKFLLKCIYPSKHFSIRLILDVNIEEPGIYRGYVFSHEHDFITLQRPVENGKQILACQLCDILYCVKCGKEVTISPNSLHAKGREKIKCP
jgi:hypothetical protein